METIKNRLERMGLWDKILERELKSLWKYGVKRIDNEAIRNSVTDFLSEEAPLSFFLNPASPSCRHHPRLAKQQMWNAAQYHRMLFAH